MDEIVAEIHTEGRLFFPYASFITFLGLLKKLKEKPTKVGFGKGDFSKEEIELIDELYAKFDWTNESLGN